MFNQIDIKVFFRQAVPALLLYLGAALAIYLGGRIAPSDMCNPGLDILLFFLLIILNLILSSRSVGQDLTTKRLKASTLVHLAVSIFVWSMFFYSS
jgi:hypothetical protein